MTKIETFTLGPVMTNAYLIYDESKQGVVIDPGVSPGILLQRIKNLGLNISAILLTHAHFDHIGGVNELRDLTSAPVYVHKKESDWLKNPMLNGSGAWPGVRNVECDAADIHLDGGQDIQLGNFKFRVLHTPGHSPGSVTYILGDQVFSGDVLFQDSIGRTDLREGDYHQLLNSIRTHLLTLSDETQVFPGHGHITTIGRERMHNPFLN